MTEWTPPKQKCLQCGKEFYGIPKGRAKVTKKFCSKVCARNHRYQSMRRKVERE